ncbi:hypothetical protein G6010_02455, partial [Dietzia sp. SLG510A3-3B2-2]|nr:hypothetical protein [Dietzia sp. SLG510A3-3B2-2]
MTTVAENTGGRVDRAGTGIDPRPGSGRIADAPPTGRRSLWLICLPLVAVLAM